jgi:cytoskeletal protein CcmA (bactofilin family)
MFGRKKERDTFGRIGAEATSRELGVDAIPPRPHNLRPELPLPGPPRLPNGDGPRRLPEITAPVVRRTEVRPPIETDSKRLHVGREIVLTGEIKTCERLVVEGRVEAALTDIRSIEIADTGVLKGKAQVESADIAGQFDGELVVQNRLHIRATGRVTGIVRYGSIEIERGGTIAGQVELMSNGAAGASDPHPMAEGRRSINFVSEPETD